MPEILEGEEKKESLERQRKEMEKRGFKLVFKKQSEEGEELNDYL